MYDSTPNDRYGVKPQFGCTMYYRNDADIAALNAANVPWVAVVKRGRCHYYRKAMYANEQGAAGLIVWYDEDKLNLMNVVGEFLLGSDSRLMLVFLLVFLFLSSSFLCF